LGKLAAALLATVKRLFRWLFRLKDPGEATVTDSHEELREVFMDFLPNSPRTDQERENFCHMLRERFEERLRMSAERIWDLPPIVLRQPREEYVKLLLEAEQPHQRGDQPQIRFNRRE
jgi:hypothetical protein